MARPGLTKHRKFRRLARLLGSDVLALGHLEWLWSVAYEDGQDYLGDADDVESAAKWGGEPGALTHALLTCGGHGHAGFIEPSPDHPEGHYRIHELWDHAPDYVVRRAGYEAERRKVKTCEACGQEYRSREARARYCSAACRATAHRQTQTNARERTSHARVTHGNAPPAPAPAPKYKIKIMSADADASDGFDAFWDAYPRHEAKAKALAAWKTLKPSPDLQVAILAAIAAQQTWRAWREGFIPHPTTWLHGRRWEDERPPEDRHAGPPVTSGEWCRDHDPPCKTQQDHVRRTLEAGRRARQEATR